MKNRVVDLLGSPVNSEGFFFVGSFKLRRNGKSGFFGLYEDGKKVMLYARIHGSVMPCANIRVMRTNTIEEIRNYLASL